MQHLGWSAWETVIVTVPSLANVFATKVSAELTAAKSRPPSQMDSLYPWVSKAHKFTSWTTMQAPSPMQISSSRFQTQIPLTSMLTAAFHKIRMSSRVI